MNKILKAIFMVIGFILDETYKMSAAFSKLILAIVVLHYLVNNLPIETFERVKWLIVSTFTIWAMYPSVRPFFKIDERLKKEENKNERNKLI